MSTIQTVQGANQVIPATVDPATSTAGEPSGTLLPSPISALALSGDPGAELAALVVQAGQAQQSSAQAARDVDEQMEVNEDNQEVAAMRKKADETRAAGIADGLGMVAEGGAAVAAVCVTPAPPAAGGKWDTRLGDALKAGGKVADGGFQVGSAFSKGAEASSDADATAHRANADQDRLAADDMHDAKKAGTDLVSAALDFYREYTTTKAQTDSAALHRA